MTPLVVVAYDEFPDTSIEQQILSRINAKVQHVRNLSTPEALDAARNADALMVTIQRVTSELIAGMTHCRLICRVGTGLDAIDVHAATEHRILVTNVPDYSVDEVSTHVIALLLAQARRLPQLINSTRHGKWDSKFVRPMYRLRGQTLGLLGFGRIGRATARKAQGLGLKVMAHDPFVDSKIIEAAGVQSVDWETLLRAADFISLHAPLTDKTRYLVNAPALAMTKPTAYLINTARGPLVDDQALLAALRSGQIAGAALDVLSVEPPPAEHPLLHEERVVITPHIGWYSEEANHDVRVWASEEVVRVFRGEKPRSPVN